MSLKDRFDLVIFDWAGTMVDFGCAAPVRALLDAFAQEGVKLHISEFFEPMGQPILGTVRTGTWNEETQARYYTEFFTMAFSHPAVELINLWGIGPVTWQNGSGLLDAKYNPKPVFNALKKLITETWHTEITGTLPLDGRIAPFRGFYGSYELIVTLPDGKVVRTTFELKQPSGSTGTSTTAPDTTAPAVYQFVLDKEEGSLKLK